MSYNVENLFDTKQDNPNIDYTFIPYELKKNKYHKQRCKKNYSPSRKNDCLYLNWDKQSFDLKIEKLSKIISSYNDGNGADILFLQEIENLNVINILNDRLDKQKYPYVFISQSNDSRGINTAILSRFPPKEPEQSIDLSHIFNRKNKTIKTRPILKIILQHNKSSIIAYGIHFPSAYYSTEIRKKAIDILNNDAKKYQNNAVIAAGDFNINSQEDNKLYRYTLGQSWEVSHIIGCHTCLGTNYFKPKDTWSFLDAILVLRNSKATLIPESINVWTALNEQKSSTGSPNKSYRNGNKVLGISDHYPIVGQIVIN